MKEISLQGLFEWLQQQAQYALFIVLIILVLVFASKRAWIAMAGSIVGLAVVGVFILNPNVIADIASWFGTKLNMR